jgi:hypothetical protein
MRLRATARALIILLVLLAGKASAWKAESCNEPYEFLASKSAYTRFVAEGYILGVIDDTHSFKRVRHLPVQWTLPSKVMKRQVFEAVTKYLKEHPEDRNEAAYILVNKALRKAFPTKR